MSLGVRLSQWPCNCLHRPPIRHDPHLGPAVPADQAAQPGLQVEQRHVPPNALSGCQRIQHRMVVAGRAIDVQGVGARVVTQGTVFEDANHSATVRGRWVTGRACLTQMGEIGT